MTPPPPAPPFENLDRLRQEHEALLVRFERAAGDDLTPEAEARTAGAMQPDIARFIECGVATGVMLDEYPERTTAQTLLDFWTSLLIRSGLPRPRGRLAAFDDEQLPELDPSLCPYVGLEPFRVEDARYFFGREEDARRVVERLAEAPLVVVRGASGSGKSSLVLGGVLPRLAAENPPRWRVARPFTPGREPNERLAAALAGLDRSEALLLVVDQFEELFTLASERDRDRFDAALTELLAEGRHRVIITVREEFSPRLMRLSGLAPLIRRPGADFSLQALGYAELVAAIEQPARLVNLRFESGIVERLVTDVLGQPAALPLLQYTLRELWSRRKRNRITWAALKEVGGPATALARAADEFLAAQIPETRAEIQRILVALVRVDDLLESYRQPVGESELLRAGSARTRAVLGLLRDRDFIRTTPTADGLDAVVEIKHEALIRNWPLLADWIVQKRKSRRSQLALLQSAQRWEQAGRPPDGLYRGWQLREALELDDLSPLERAFLEASKLDVDRELAEARKLSARRRTLLIIAGVVLALMAVQLGVIFYSWASLRDDARELLTEIREETARAEAEVVRDKIEVGRVRAEAEIAAKTLEAKAEETVREARARNRKELDELKSRSSEVGEQLRKDSWAGLKFEAKELSIRQLGITCAASEPRVERLATVLRAVGVKVDVATGKVPARATVFFYYREDEEAARGLATLLERWLGVSVTVSDKVGDPDFFAPGKRPPVKRRIALYLPADAFPPMLAQQTLALSEVP